MLKGQMSLADESRAESRISSEYTNIRACSSNIKKDLGLTTETGALKDNVKKNRYKDILPYDQTRVPLTLLTRENDSDYINASFIKGATKTRKYIATQGPLSNTLVDFWRMIWQYDVKVIIMACREFENGKKKCECYWTTFKETAPFGPFIVSNNEESSPNEEVVARTLTVQYHDETRTISQYQYTAWPDHDIPYKADGVLGMMDMARKTQGNNTSPILIHCSAGCGRTGVICVLDYVHELLVTKQIKEHFSIQDIVIELRRQRPSAVQTKEQYQFLFSAVAYMFEKALHENNYQNLTESNKPLCGDVGSEKTYTRDSSLQPKEPKHLQRKMNDTYAVVNKSKQLPPPESSVTPLSTLHHYDNAELGTSKCPVGAVYSSVKPKTRCPPANLPPAASSVYDTARPSNHMLEKALSTVSDDDYEYVLGPNIDETNTSTPGGMGFNCRIKKPKGPRDPPAEWSRVER
ncbi:tyrosine-protein phosphatase non-receptor type 18 isoform X2 [Esox lucius]|uniref:tyrosine-protein phosphatase non-receptor type 18 isoform X2 n=1 Tax=Esox lucius TaxID=8010 RepID=UPI0014775B21|nr:tyrosine-protein phosphatase non-receptor type 18 isoform X2 [Esox lucius]